MSARVLFLDPSLGVVRGHHAPLARGFAACVGAPVVFAGAKGGRLKLRDGAAFAPAFGYRTHDAFRVARHANPLLGHRFADTLTDVARVVRWRRGVGASSEPLSLAAFKRLFAPLRAAKSVTAMLDTPGLRHVVSVAADPAVLCALHTLAPRFAAREAPRLHLVFMYPERDYLTHRTQSAHTSVLRDMLDWPVPPLLYAELAEHATDLQAAFAAPVEHQILPYRTEQASTPAPPRPFTVAVLGAGRADKGFAELPAIVAAVRARGAELVFRIQSPGVHSGLATQARALAATAGVRMLPTFLDDEAYEAELARAHVVLLAYDVESYARRGSGVFVDAVMFGRPLVCAAGTALARSLRMNGVTGRGAEGLADALIESRARYQELAKAAARVRAETFSAMRDGPLLSALLGAPT